MPLRLDIDVVRFRAQPRGAALLALGAGLLLLLGVATFLLGADALSFEARTPEHLLRCRSTPASCARNDRLSEQYPELAPELPDGTPFSTWNPFNRHREAVLCERYLADPEGFDPDVPWLIAAPDDRYVGWRSLEAHQLEPAVRTAFLAMVQETLALDPPDPPGRIFHTAPPEPTPERRPADAQTPDTRDATARLKTLLGSTTMEVPCRTPYRVADVEGWLLEDLRTEAIRERSEEAIATFHETDRSTVISHRLGLVLLGLVLPALGIGALILGLVALRRRRTFEVELRAGRLTFAGIPVAREEVAELRMDGARLELRRSDGRVLRSPPLRSADVTEADTLCDAFAGLAPTAEGRSTEELARLQELLGARRDRADHS